MVSNSLLSLLPFIWWNHTGSSTSAGPEEAVVFCVQNNYRPENLNRFACKKSEDILHHSVSRVKTSLLNLDGNRLSVLQDCICVLGIFIRCVFITF